MTDLANLSAAELLPCPCCQSTDLIGGEHETGCVYCKKCWLRAVSPEAWNTRTGQLVASTDALVEREEAVGVVQLILDDVGYSEDMLGAETRAALAAIKGGEDANG